MPNKTTCFLIDDDYDDQMIFKTALEELDESFSCVYARDGIEALEMFHKDPAFLPDFIFLDLHMPVMDGKRCLIEIKKIDRLIKIPVFIYTAAIDHIMKRETEAIGAAGFILKPISFSAIKQDLKEIIDYLPMNNSSEGKWY
jgi:CheY-like chemotaxis protein